MIALTVARRDDEVCLNVSEYDNLAPFVKQVIPWTTPTDLERLLTSALSQLAGPTEDPRTSRAP